MASTPSPPTTPVGIAHIIGSPAGRALANKVEEACRMVQPLEISDEEYAARRDWAPPIPVSIILRQVLCPAVFVLQQALDPSFHRVGYGRFEFPVSTTQMVQGSLRKLMELVHLISLTDPEYPSYVALWDGVSGVHLIPDEPPVSDVTMGQLEILEYMAEVYGFAGENTAEGVQMSAALEHLKRQTEPESFAPPAWMAELESVIHELRRGTPEERLRLDTASVEIPDWREATDTWLPSHSMADLLRYSIRPQVYFIQSIVDPDFTLSTPFPPMKASLGREVRGAIRRVLDQLKLLHDSRPHFAKLARVAHNKVRLEDIIVPGASSNMFRILRIIMGELGYEGDQGARPQPYDPLFAFIRFEDTALISRASLAHEREFPDFNVDGSLFFAPRQSVQMALRFALLRDYHRGDPSSFRSRTQFEVFFIDLDTEEDLVRFLRRPEVARFSQQILAPLRDQVMPIRDRFHLAPPVARDSPWIRFQTSIYMRFLFQTIEAFQPDGSQLRPVASLLYMMRLIRRFGFEGDDEATRASSAKMISS
ncbi:hypothetical protein B0H16DRAFT_1480241 [Mycena metata]|uniref:Uncharacterized protein n=1 Tax=Mycena metata TaxID=1033252 RepID=A0AAD7H499_9AGAR|nr:hypothetical protein B0H16DRAFT_1480241 [Mycena metata]